MTRLEQHAQSLIGNLEGLAVDPMEDAAMSKYSKPRWSRRRGRKHRTRHDESDSLFETSPHDDDTFYREDHPSEFEETNASLYSEPPGQYRHAREIAEKRAELLLRAGKEGFIVLCLLIFMGPIGVMALIYWVLKFGRRLFSVVVEPGLRERLVEEQVSRRIRENVGRERIEIADEHAHSLEVLSASIAHEIRNPITAAKSLLQQLRDDPGLADNEEYAQVALGELERVERSISHLLRFGRVFKY